MFAGFSVNCARSIPKNNEIVACLTQTKRKFTTKSKIIVKKPIVEVGGDEMSKIVSDKIKQQLIIPYVNLERDYHDCSLANRIKTNNEVVHEAAEAILKFKVGVKCATIRCNEKDFNLPTAKSVFEKTLNGTQFRESIVCNHISKFIPRWSKPIMICRHTYYENPDDPEGIKQHTEDLLTQKSYIDSVNFFAETCFQTALDKQFPLYFSSKYNRLNKNAALFYDVFLDQYINKFKRLFDKQNLIYEQCLTDEMAEEAKKSIGGFMWAMKSYDCDMLTNVIGQGVGSMAMMVYTYRSHDGKAVLTEPAHGGITKHYQRHLKGKETSTNPISSIFSWTRGLQHRAKLDCNYHLLEFAELLEQCALATIEEGNLTKDLAQVVFGGNIKEDDFIKTKDFIELVARKVKLNINKIFPREEAKTVI